MNANNPLKVSFTKYHGALMAKLRQTFAAKTDLPGEATETSPGLISAADKAKLDGLGQGSLVPSGGFEGQALVKASGADGDYAWGDVAASGGGVDETYVDLHDAFSAAVETVPGASVTFDCSGSEPSALDERRAAAFGAENMYSVDITAEQAAKLYEVLDVDSIAAVPSDDERMTEFVGENCYVYEPGASIDCRFYVNVGSNKYLIAMILKPGDGEPESTDIIGMIDCDLDGGMFAMFDSTDVRAVTVFPEGETSAEPVEVVSYSPKAGAVRATAANDGIMSASDKAKLDALDPDLVTVGSVAATSPITASLNEREVTVAHKDSGVASGSYGSNSGAVKTFGDKFVVPAIGVEAKGHVYTAQNMELTFPSDTATQYKNGLMSSSDKKKLDSAVVSVTPLSDGAGIYVSEQSAGYLKLSHALTKTQKTCGDTHGDRELGFQQGFTVPKVSIDSNGHVTNLEESTIVLTSETATTSKAGLMSASDKWKLDALSSSSGGSSSGGKVERVWASFGDNTEYYLGNSPFGWKPVLTEENWSLQDSDNYFEDASNCSKAETDTGLKVTRTSGGSGFSFVLDITRNSTVFDLPTGTYAMMCSMRFGGSASILNIIPVLVFEWDGVAEYSYWTLVEPEVIGPFREGVDYQFVITYDVKGVVDYLTESEMNNLLSFGFKFAFPSDVSSVELHDMALYRVNDVGGTTVPQSVIDYVDGKLGVIENGSY